MNFSTLSIHQKITGLLIIYFVIAFVAIASTLMVSWRLEGGAAAINDAGSQRMRSYSIAFLLAQHVEDPSSALTIETNNEINLFEKTLLVLEKGDPVRPLLLPNDPELRSSLKQIQKAWFERNKPHVLDILKETNTKKASRLLENYRSELKAFVADIDALVVMVEQSQARATKLLRSFQLGLVILALIGTLLLIYLFMRMVIIPVHRIKDGLDKMGKGDFSVRLPVNGQDELEELAVGFNRMAEHLQEIYATLEQRVKSKTQSIEFKSRELAALYDTTSFLNTASATEILCDGVLGKMVMLFGASAGVIRLIDPKHEKAPIVAWYGVSEDFLTKESTLSCGDCLCGESAIGASAVSCKVADIDQTELSRHTCQNEGFEGIIAAPIKTRQNIIGVFNLFFKEPRVLPPSEVKLLETVSQHLGAAIENQRFVEREKELAISEERNLLAQELHDSIAQSLAFLNIQAQLLQDSLRKGHYESVDGTLVKIKEGIQESYDDVRELLVHFRTRTEHDDIDVAIRSALEKFEGQTGIKTRYKYEGNAVPLQPETILQLMHILHESLSNIRKHSQATLVEVTFRHEAGCQMIIKDNGIGFDNTKEISDTHVGLRIMKERTHRIHANLTINSVVGSGTTVCLNLPLASNSFLVAEAIEA